MITHAALVLYSVWLSVDFLHSVLILSDVIGGNRITDEVNGSVTSLKTRVLPLYTLTR